MRKPGGLNMPLRHAFCGLAALSLLVLPSAAMADVETNPSGWTVITPSSDTRMVYVSDVTGNDENSGLDAGSPVKTLARGASLLRDGQPDWLLLKRGETWTNQNLGDWTKRGRSAQEPMLISAYGEGDRPLLRTGNSNGITMWRGGVDYSNIAIIGLHFEAHTNTGLNGAHGIRLDRPGQNLLIEDVELEKYATNIVAQSTDPARPFENLSIRRSVIHDAFAQHTGISGGSHSQGIYTSNVRGILIEENVLDHNGHNPEVAGAEPTIFNHNLYIQTDSDDLVVRGNIISRAAAHGLQARPGGLVEDNLFLDNSMAMFIAGEGGTAIDNVILHGSTNQLLPDGQPRAWGIDMKDIDVSEALRNIIAHTPGGTQALVGLAGVTSEDNVVYKWGTESWVGEYPDPERTIAAYDALHGGNGSLESFLMLARQLSRDDYDARYTAGGANPWFREGFGLSIPEPAGVALLLLPAALLSRRRRC
jgi:hypothetical protein